MSNVLWRVIPLAVVAVSTSLCTLAQTNAVKGSTEEQKAEVNPPAPLDKGSAPAATSSAAKGELKPTVEQEIEALKNRIGELENEVRQAHAEKSADGSDDAAALRIAAKQLTAGSGPGAMAAAAPSLGESASTTGLQGQQVAAQPAAPAAPEISAQRTTKGEPFPGDWTWLNSNGHASDSPMATKYFTPEFRADANYTLDFNHPKDDTLGGSTETFRSDEWQLEQMSIGGDIHIDNVRGRILFMDGLFATTTPRNDGSVSRGNWDLVGAYKYISEGWGGYHWDVQHGINLDAGIFVSYIGLFSYYNFDNWTYQPSFVSSNTPWFFNGLRLQWFPTKNLKIEPWFINGW